MLRRPWEIDEIRGLVLKERAIGHELPPSSEVEEPRRPPLGRGDLTRSCGGSTLREKYVGDEIVTEKRKIGEKSALSLG